MAKGTISHVTKDEIEATMESFIPSSSAAQKSASGSAPMPSKYRVQMREQLREPRFKLLKNDEIVKWFAPFGYDYHEIVTEVDSNSEFLCVVCEDFAILFNDFELFMEELPQSKEESARGFDFVKFKEHCFHQNRTPEQVLNEYVKDKMEKRFTSYAENRHAYDENKLKKLKEDRKKANFPKEIDNLFASLAEKDRAILDMEENRIRHGKYFPDGQ